MNTLKRDRVIFVFAEYLFVDVNLKSATIAVY